MEKTIVIIGAGIAGLATGCYARMNGYKTIILEMHDKPGGQCTSWKRKGYVFDYCIHHLAGAVPASKMYRIWKELGAVKGVDMMFFDEVVRVETLDGKSLTMYTDIDKLEKHLKEISPGDSKVIDEYTRALRLVSRYDMFGMLAGGPGDMVRLLPHIGQVLKWFRMPLESLGAKFQDTFLRRAIPVVQYGFVGIPSMLHMMFLTGCGNKTLGWPKGGSLAFAQAMASRYLDLGGELIYRSRVQRIMVNSSGGQDRAVGVVLQDGTEVRADIVISAADGRSTIYDMLGGKYTTKAIDDYYAQAPESQDMQVDLFFGVRRDMSGEPVAITFLLDQPFTVAGETLDRLHVQIQASNTGLAASGTSVVKVAIPGRYAYWKALSQDLGAYTAEKRSVAQGVLSLLERRFPGLSDDVEIIDVTTPVTMERYTGNYRGLQAYPPKKGALVAMMKGLSRTLPRLSGFYMVGHWANATLGLPSVSISARGLVKHICKKDGVPFLTTEA